MAAKYRLTTLGCKVNQYESQQLRELLEAFGFRQAKEGETADLAVVNTCAVTGSASSKSRQAIRRAANRGTTPVVVVGCGATENGRQLSNLSGVAAVLGHDRDIRRELESLLYAKFADGSGRLLNQRALAPEDRDGVDFGPSFDRSTAAVETFGTPSQVILSHSLPIVKTDEVRIGRIERFEGHHRAFLKVQDGCDAFCTYCIIPRLRSTLRSKPIPAAVEEARTLVRHGYKEIVLTGIFLGAYGRETAIRRRFRAQPSPLAELVAALAKVEGLERLRLSSLEPGDVHDELLGVLSANSVCVPHLHLPLQSGSEFVLRMMNRQYTAEDFVDMVDRVKDALDRPAISTDIIVGFPGETEQDFEFSCEIARNAHFCKIHAFPFSPKAHTPAARRQKEFIRPPIVRERVQRLAVVERECSLSYRRTLLGSIERVLVEEPSVGERSDQEWDDTTEMYRGFSSEAELDSASIVDDDSAMESPMFMNHGRADRYVMVHFETDRPIRTGDVVPVHIDRLTHSRTHGIHIPVGAGRIRLPVV